MKKSIIVTSLIFLFILSACGTNNEPTSLPEPTVTVSDIEPIEPSGTNIQSDVILDFISDINTLDKTKAIYNSDNSSITIQSTISSSTLYELIDAITSLPEQADEAVNNIDNLANTFYNEMDTREIQGITLLVEMLDVDGQVIALYINGQCSYNLLRSALNSES